jgi:hypothetical protein
MKIIGYNVCESQMCWLLGDQVHRPCYYNNIRYFARMLVRLKLLSMNSSLSNMLSCIKKRMEFQR